MREQKELNDDLELYNADAREKELLLAIASLLEPTERSSHILISLVAHYHTIIERLRHTIDIYGRDLCEHDKMCEKFKKCSKTAS